MKNPVLPSKSSKLQTLGSTHLLLGFELSPISNADVFVSASNHLSTFFPFLLIKAPSTVSSAFHIRTWPSHWQTTACKHLPRGGSSVLGQTGEHELLHEGRASSTSQSRSSGLSWWPRSHTVLVDWSKPILNFLLTIRTGSSSSHVSRDGSSPRSWVTFAAPLWTLFNFAPNLWSTASGAPACGANAAQKQGPFHTDILHRSPQCSFHNHRLAEHNPHLVNVICDVPSEVSDFWVGSLKKQRSRLIQASYSLLPQSLAILVQFYISCKSVLVTENTCQQADTRSVTKGLILNPDSSFLKLCLTFHS